MVETHEARRPGAVTPTSAAGRSPAPMRAPGDAAMIAGYIGKGDDFDEAIARLRRRLCRSERA